MIGEPSNPVISVSAFLFAHELIRKVKEGGVWVCANGFSVWKLHKKRKVAQVVGDNSEVNRSLKALFLNLGWSVLERELESEDKQEKEVKYV